ncbi:hypothetical protein D3C75_1266420 [compost metagenome]
MQITLVRQLTAKTVLVLAQITLGVFVVVLLGKFEFDRVVHHHVSRTDDSHLRDQGVSFRSSSCENFVRKSP